MGDKKTFLQNAKLRVVIAIVVCVGLVALVIGLWRHHLNTSMLHSSASVSSGPAIQSLPGAGTPSNAYVQTQNLENALQSKAARSAATSFVPTITRQGFVGSASSFADDDSASADKTSQLQCPIKKVVYMYKPNPASCTVDNLRLARAAGVTAEELVCQSCSCPALRLVGYTAGELKAVGYGAADLQKCGYDLADLKNAGFSASALKAAGFTASDLKAVGFSAGELAAAGFSKEALQAAGYSPAELRAAMVTSAKDCSVAELQKARAAGDSAAALHAQGCELSALKAAGFTAAELKNAGFSANDLKAAGFTAGDLKAAGFTAAELKNAGFTAQELKNAGFKAADLKKAGFSVADLKAAGFSPSAIQAALAAEAGCSAADLKKARMAGTSATALKEKGCDLTALKAAGFTAAELKNAGFSASDLKAAGFSANDLKAAGFNANELKAAGFSADALKKAGFSANDLKAAGFTAGELKKAGFSAAELKSAGFNANDLKAAGFDAKDLKDAGFSASDLKAAGFSAGDLKNAGFSAADLVHAGYSAKALHDAGFTAAELKAAGVPANVLKAAGYTKGDLLRAGYTPEEAGYAMTVAPTTPTAPATPTPTATSTSHDAIAGGASMPDVTSDSPEAHLRAIQQMEQEQLNQQQRRDMLQQMQGQMSLQAQKLMAEWSNNSQQVVQVAIEKPEVTNNAGADTKGNSGPTGPVFKAGQVLFAVLDTSINSDEKTPILATIVTGELKGAKLIGSFQRVDKKLLIQFNLMNVGGLTHTVSINAVAIDPNTARTALAGDVNNHYLLRYGTLFAAGFVSGLSQGIIQSGSTQDCFFGFCHTTYQKLSPGEYIALGLGNVGQQYASVMSQNFNRPPTIQIAGGTGVGVLFMTDTTLPEPLPQKNLEINDGGK